MTERFCGYCGATLEGDHARCRTSLQMEPPRYCPHCGRRMKVQVTPRGWSATCVEHGTRSS
jgi:hypothetical protein